MRLLTTTILILGAAALASADNVRLRNGEVIQGTYLGGTARQVRMDVNGEVRTIEISEIRSISFAEDVQPAAPPPQARDYPRGERYQQGHVGTTIPADTAITIRMIDAVNSETARLGQTFRASIDEPVVVDGQQVIPRGADVITKLVDDQKSGRIQGRTVLTLALESVTINGRLVDVTSTDVKTASSSRGGRSGAVIGGGAAVGAIIGAIAGGGKGAAIGAASGGALGAGTEVLTGGQKVKIPSETRLTFRLQTPVQI